MKKVKQEYVENIYIFQSFSQEEKTACLSSPFFPVHSSPLPPSVVAFLLWSSPKTRPVSPPLCWCCCPWLLLTVGTHCWTRPWCVLGLRRWGQGGWCNASVPTSHPWGQTRAKLQQWVSHSHPLLSQDTCNPKGRANEPWLVNNTVSYTHLTLPTTPYV